MDAETTSSSVILFYKYHALSSDPVVVGLYRVALEELCTSLQLRGRILVGCNAQRSEGINGTLGGKPSCVQAFTLALCNEDGYRQLPTELSGDEPVLAALQKFAASCQVFYEKAQCDPLIMTPDEFKWSTAPSSNDGHFFPDLNIKLVKELIGTGGLMSQISIADTAQGYLTPQQWHDQLKSKSTDNTIADANDTVLIDCRNTKEYQIGHFPNAINPNTTTFHQFPKWVEDHQHSLAGKKVLMYCTGGIRCEKASAYIRKTVPDVQTVSHLKGGIHKYLEEYGATGIWQGKNFVFDGRGAATADETQRNAHNHVNIVEMESGKHGDVAPNNNDLIGRCVYCPTPYDVFDPRCVCTVCREPTLVCKACQERCQEYHCQAHFVLRRCYFTQLNRFSSAQLLLQHQELQKFIADIAIGRKYKQRRKTLQKQVKKIEEYLKTMPTDHNDSLKPAGHNQLQCRNCGEVECDGKCWGFLGLARKHKLEETSAAQDTGSQKTKLLSIPKKSKGNNRHLQERKEAERQSAIQELVNLRICRSGTTHRNPKTGIRVPPPCTRLISTKTKGKWCGLSVLKVVQEEFDDLANTQQLSDLLQRGLLRVNDTKIESIEQAETHKLKNMDTVSRVLHWHEPPVNIPGGGIPVQKVDIPTAVVDEYGLSSVGVQIFVCDKPSSVPVHPAGPYLANSLTAMVEGQENLEPKSLIPCHRIDRATSGLTICCTDVAVARLVQTRIGEGAVQKLYIAKVKGRFPEKSSMVTERTGLPKCTDWAEWSWTDEDSIEVRAPIETVDPAKGIRTISANGKPSNSLLKLLSWDDFSDTSLVACRPLTGRSHQLRVHLQWLGCPIVMDTLYGGEQDQSMDKNGEQALKESLLLDPTLEATGSSIMPDDVQAAREVCRCCNRGVDEAFSDAQLLQGGHSICLHAIRYQIPFKKKKAKNEKDGQDLLVGTLDLNVDMPIWANGLDGAALSWLE